MLFTFLVAVIACQSTALRPELGRVSISSQIADVGDIMMKVSSPSESLVALKAATDVLDGVLAEMGNATEHMSEDDATLLRSVITLVDDTIYTSMDQSHDADVSALADAVSTAAGWNSNIEQRQSPEGDLGIFHQQVEDKQTELNRLQGIVDDKRSANDTKWDAFDTHMQMISTPPACPGLPARNMGALDVFFEQSEYSAWYAAQQASYNTVRDAFKDADEALQDAIESYNIHKAVRDQQYCDWKTELKAACEAFDASFKDTSDFFTNTLVPRVEAWMNGRINVKKAGDTMIHQIKFLLGEVNEQQTPTIDTSRYEIAFPELPPKGVCDLSPLESDKWVPMPDCITFYQMEPGSGITYYQMEQGSCCCPEGRQIATQEECAEAQLSFRTGGPADITWSGSYSGIPGGCSWRSHGSPGAGRGHWNTNVVGGPRDDMIPICRSLDSVNVGSA